MFGKKKDPQPAAETKAPTPPSSLKRPTRMAPPSIIGTDLVVTGTLTSNGHVQIDGQVKGDVHCAALVIGERAQIQGDVLSEDVTIRGHVRGNIRAHKVHLSSTSRVEGDIHRQSMAVESGAFFEGSSRHSEDPLAGAGPAKKAAADSRPADGIVKLAR
jgi:cytoskeletal protein CcmA (bactofilin family)